MEFFQRMISMASVIILILISSIVMSLGATETTKGCAHIFIRNLNNPFTEHEQCEAECQNFISRQEPSDTIGCFIAEAVVVAHQTCRCLICQYPKSAPPSKDCYYGPNFKVIGSGHGGLI